MRFSLHPLCALFPRMVGAEMEALKADIKANGLHYPIITHKGTILDGGNRYEACMAVGVKPIMTEYTGTNLVEYVLSANFHRRHLSKGQQATIVASATDWAKAQTHGGDRKTDQGEGLHLETVKQRAAVSGATERTQKDADTLARKNPEAAKQVAHGEKSLYQAVKEGKPAKPKNKSKPKVVTVTTPPLPDYTELDAKNDQIEDLQAMLAVANTAPEDRDQAKNLIAELRAEIKTLRIANKALVISRDTFQNENAQLRKQVNRQRHEIDKATGSKTA